jgi:hypothetical protein
MAGVDHLQVGLLGFGVRLVRMRQILTDPLAGAAEIA